jgi:hypothetical protein
MFNSLNSEDEAPAGRRLYAFGYGTYCLFGAIGFAMAAFRGQGAPHLLSAAIYLTMLPVSRLVAHQCSERRPANEA